MRRRIIAEEPWNYVLFQDEESWIITYLAGSVGMYDVSIKLTKEEVEVVAAQPPYAKTLVDKMRARPTDYRDREIRPSVWPK